ncbi:MAG: Na+/H+ antiporter NhaA [Coriobacteriales bacterium]
MRDRTRLPHSALVGPSGARHGRIACLAGSSTFAAAVMLGAALLSLVIANSPAREGFEALWEARVRLGLGPASASISIGHIVNDALMAAFFLLVGIEIKHEATSGELADPRRAALPVVAALGGALVPMGLYLALNAGLPTQGGWGVPMATDIAFALGLLALLGDRVPTGLKVFLSTLAVADDIIAIVVIALFYGHAPDLAALALAGACLAALFALNRAGVLALAPYLALGCLLWAFVYLSGVHATIAGVLLALAIPRHVRPDAARRAGLPGSAARSLADEGGEAAAGARQDASPAGRLERALRPWVNLLVLPLFALANAGVVLGGIDLGDDATARALAGVLVGLVLGKPVGVLLTSAALVRAGVARLPTGVGWRHMAGAGMLAGVGFTMAVFVSGLAFDDAAYASAAKAGILAASALSGALGLLVLRRACVPAGQGGRVAVGVDGGRAPQAE